MNEIGVTDRARIRDDPIVELAETFHQARADASGGAGDDCNFSFGAHDLSCSIGKASPCGKMNSSKPRGLARIALVLSFLADGDPAGASQPVRSRDCADTDRASVRSRPGK